MKKNNHIYLVNFLILSILTCSHSVNAAVWQWSVSVKNAKENAGQSRAFLWVPPDCKNVKAFIFSQNNMEEQSILENTKFREEMGKLGIAEVWVSPSFDHLFRFNEGAGETFTGIMNDLANVSGYSELSYAPFVGMGHSASASAPYYMAAWNPERALAAISVSGQWPFFRSPVFAPEIWGDKNLDSIPCLETMGEYEAAATWSDEGLKERQNYPLLPLSMLANPAQGHFAATNQKIAYIAFYLKKVMQYRYPKNPVEGKPPKLIPIDPIKTGWLVDKWRYNQAPLANPAPVNKYKGDAAQAFWFFDEELAQITTAYQAKYSNQKPQLIGYMQAGKMVEQRDTHQQVNLKFEPEADGITFKLHAAFYDTVPAGSPRLRMWTDLAVGKPIGHANGGGPIKIDRITGPVTKLNDSTFRVNPQLGFLGSQRNYELWFAATHTGDNEYKPAVQQAQMLLPAKNIEGKAQHITFSAIPNQQKNKKAIQLKASSDASVPVYFYVLEGPAEIKGNILNITSIPLRSSFPIKVTVIAWQYGNSNEPKLQTAIPVERAFWIDR